MKVCYVWMALLVLTCSALPQSALADCAVSEASKLFDPVEVGFCESDVVFVGTSEGAIETIGGVTPEGSATKHFRIQRSTLQVLERHKGELPDKVKLVADLYAKDGAFVFEYGKTYLIFAKRLAAESEFVGAGSCSVQTTLPIGDAAKVLKQLALHKKGSKKIDCTSIRAKAKA
jgi:hypothetical protein